MEATINITKDYINDSVIIETQQLAVREIIAKKYDKKWVVEKFEKSDIQDR
ncbi:MAG: hypothetical protein M1840_005907 [Geoglossum simile]|nr:MAG: hypothetical protein M1840_005907 [Geoglossum simile]